jgi:predicted nuclease with RNAse H fold
VSAAAQPVVVGIDVAARRPSVAVSLTCGRSTAAVDGWFEADAGRKEGLSALLDWVVSRSPSAVAVDAPQGFNRRLMAGSTLRVCDWELRRRGLPLYQVPQRGAEVPGWMQTGYDIFRGLARRDFERPRGDGLPASFGQAQAVLEVYPYASFAALLREAQVAGTLSVEQRLLRKTTGDGALLRLRLLRLARLEWDWWLRYLDHDHIDAMAAAGTAWRYLTGAATGVGDEREGLLWLPVTAEFLRDHLPPRSGTSSLPRG